MDGAWGVPVSVRLAVANWPSDAGHGAVAEFCRTQGISRSWFYALRARARGDGPVAVVKPRSRRPRSSPSRIDPALEQLALQLRADLLADGWDGGPISVRLAMLDAGVGVFLVLAHDDHVHARLQAADIGCVRHAGPHVGVQSQRLAQGHVDALVAAALWRGDRAFQENASPVDRFPRIRCDSACKAALVYCLANLDGLEVKLSIRRR